MSSIRARRMFRLKMRSRVIALRRYKLKIQHEQEKERKVEFSNSIKVIHIPSRKEYDRKTKSLMWWSQEDYDEFIRDYILENELLYGNSDY